MARDRFRIGNAAGRRSGGCARAGTGHVDCAQGAAALFFEVPAEHVPALTVQVPQDPAPSVCT